MTTNQKYKQLHDILKGCVKNITTSYDFDTGAIAIFMEHNKPIKVNVSRCVYGVCVELEIPTQSKYYEKITLSDFDVKNAFRFNKVNVIISRGVMATMELTKDYYEVSFFTNVLELRMNPSNDELLIHD